MKKILLLGSALLSLSLNLFAQPPKPSITLNGRIGVAEKLFGIYQNVNHGCLTKIDNTATTSLYLPLQIAAAEVTLTTTSLTQPLTLPLPCAALYGAWIDGPMNPYRVNQDTYFQIPHSENFRIKIPGNDWGNRNAWTMEGQPFNSPSITISGAQITPPQRDQVESHYNNRNWIFSVYSNGTTNLNGLTHHEWYPSSIPVRGIDGFINTATWVASIGSVKSFDGGQTWQMPPVNLGSSRMVVVPQPSLEAKATQTYGFMHPSNIVKEDNYYYVFTSNANVSKTTSGAITQSYGVTLFRTTDISLATNWQYFGEEKSWVTVSHNTYQGNLGAQRPHVFFKRADRDCTTLSALNVRKHKTSRQWITLGSLYCLPTQNAADEQQYQAVFSWSKRLDNPIEFDVNAPLAPDNFPNFSKVTMPADVYLPANEYYSFFDTNPTLPDNITADPSFQWIGDHPLLVVVGKDKATYFHQWLTLADFPKNLAEFPNKPVKRTR